MNSLRGGFNLIELMIAVAIIGILASMAIPSFARFQMRSKTAEAGANLAGIRTAQTAYFAELGSYVSAAPSPAAHSGSNPQTFVDFGGAFAVLGWEPEGQVYFNYAVAVAGAAHTADASANLDNDGTPQVWGYVHPDGAGNLVVGWLSCAGVWDPSSGLSDGVDRVGPCGPSDGRTEF